MISLIFTCSDVHQCSECSYMSKWDFAFNNHLKWHRRHRLLNPFNCSTEVEVYFCKICDYKAVLQVNLYQHQKRLHVNHESFRDKVHKKELTFIEQELCNAAPEVMQLSDHQCVRCGLLTFSTIFLFKHLESCLMQIDDGSFLDLQAKASKTNCQVGKISSKFECTELKNNLRKHQINKHDASVEIKSFRCQYCEYKTKHRSHLKMHQICKHTVSTKINWFQCQYCDYKAKKKSHLKQHYISKHFASTEITWFQCQKCDFQAKHKGNLKQHQINKHAASSEITWFNCLKCQYRTKLKSHLKRHQINKHAGSTEVNWFECQDCAYKAKQKSDLKNHQNSKHASTEIVWHKCYQCNYKTKWKSALKPHQISKHSVKAEITWFECQ